MFAMKRSYLLFFLIFFLALSSELIADTFKLDTGQIIEGVILNETETEYTVAIPLGKIAIKKDNVLSLEKASLETNNALRQKWKQNKIEYRNKLRQETTQGVQEKDGKRLIRYKSMWLTEEEYNTLKKEQQLAREKHLAAIEEKNRAEERKRELQDLQEKTAEIISQHKRKRSPLGNSLLKDEGWLALTSRHCIVFIENRDLYAQGKNISRTAEYYFDKIRGDLNLKDYFTFDENIEIFLIEQPKWKSITAYAPQIESAAGFAHYYKKEIYLNVTASKDHLQNILGHEMSHLFLREYVIENFSKKHRIPLWLNEGFANFEGALLEYALPQKTLIDGIRKNYYIKLDRLTAISDYPEEVQTRSFFYAEATILIEFVLTNYGRERFREFIDAVIQKQHQHARNIKHITEKDSKKIISDVVNTTFLHKYYAGYASFEEAWLRYISE